MRRTCVLRMFQAAALAAIVAASGCQLAGKPESIRLFQNAQKLYDGERYVQAAVAYRAWLADYRDSTDTLRPLVLYKLGESYRHMRDYESAARCYDEVTKVFTGSTSEHVQKVVGLAKLRFEDVKPLLKKPAEAEQPAAGTPDKPPAK